MNERKTNKKRTEVIESHTDELYNFIFSRKVCCLLLNNTHNHASCI